MLECHRILVDGRSMAFDCSVRATENLLSTFQFWTAYVARDLLRLGVYFKALGIMVQVPDAINYRYLSHEDEVADAPPDADDPNEWICGTDPGTVLGVLDECLRRLDADPDILRQITEVKHLQPEKLSVRWRRYLDREAEYDCGLLNVVAECLDELIVRPGYAAIDRGPQSTWWQNCWSQIEDES